MKIAFVVGQFPVLSETFILNQITGLIDQGHEIDIHAFGQTLPDTSKMHPDVEKYCLLSRTHYYFPKIPNNYFLRVLKCLELVLTKGYKDPLALLEALNFLKYGKQAASLRWLCGISSLLGKEPYDIVHCQFGPYALKAMCFRNFGVLKGKLVVSFRGYDISQYLMQYGDEVYNQLFEAGDFFLPNCEYFKRRLLQLGCDQRKVVVHRSGIDCGRFIFTLRCPPLDGHISRIRLATTGRLVEKKGIEYAIRAIAKTAKLNQNIKYEYNIIGDGPLRQDLQQLIQELNVSDIVKLLGQKQQQEIIEILHNSHIFIATSVTAKDGNQDGPVNTLKEAMAMGLPVIGTNHGGIPELVEDGVSGFLVPERDVDAIAERLAYLVEHPEVWSSMGQAGRACLEEQYDTNKLNDRLVEIYQQLLMTDADLEACQELYPPMVVENT